MPAPELVSELRLQASAATQLELRERCVRCLGWQLPFLEDLHASTLLSAESLETLASRRLLLCLGAIDCRGRERTTFEFCLQWLLQRFRFVAHYSLMKIRLDCDVLGGRGRGSTPTIIALFAGALA